MRTSNKKPAAGRRLKNMQSELFESKTDMAAIFAAMNELVFIFDKKGNYINIVPTNSTDFYLEPKKLIGRNISEVFSKETTKTFLSKIKEVAKNRDVITFEYKLGIMPTTVAG